jgi:hypothetical protein
MTLVMFDIFSKTMDILSSFAHLCLSEIVLYLVCRARGRRHRSVIVMTNMRREIDTEMNELRNSRAVKLPTLLFAHISFINFKS